jgi:hypothetical protein
MPTFATKSLSSAQNGQKAEANSPFVRAFCSSCHVTAAGGRTPGNDIITPSQCTVHSSTVITVELLDNYNVYKVFRIVNTQFLSFRICKNANPQKKNFTVTGTRKFENGRADLNLLGKYFSMLEIWKHYD